MTFIRHPLFALCLSALLAMAAPVGVRAAEPVPENAVTLRGFGTVGLTHNNTGGAEFIRDILQPRGVANGWSGNVDTRIGLQINARATAEIEGVAQVVSAYNHAGSYDPELAWAFISYAPGPDLKARAGRLGWDVFMLSDTRNVGYSYLWVRPPVDYFGPLQISHIDGADAVFNHTLGGGLASAKLYGGRARQQVPSPPGADYELTGTRVLGTNLNYRKGDWLFRADYTVVRLNNEVPDFVPLLAALRSTGSPAAASLATDLALADKTVEIVSAGAVYEHGPWQSQLMFNRHTSNSLAYPQKDSGYFLLGYRRGQWTPFVTLAATRSQAAPQRGTGLPTPNPLDGAVSTVLAGTQSRQHTLSLGVRYDFMRNAALKVQLDRIRVQDNAAFLWRNPQPGWNGRATVFSLALDFVF
ncbi:MAG: porin [Burkholderiales bacterium]|nr:porin [Burkholderiales bacterium]